MTDVLVCGVPEDDEKRDVGEDRPGAVVLVAAVQPVAMAAGSGKAAEFVFTVG
ncbi:MAG: hypothetical protein ACYDGN_05005 [Acidimicrobiales bacterium]